MKNGIYLQSINNKYYKVVIYLQSINNKCYKVVIYLQSKFLSSKEYYDFFNYCLN